MTDKITALKKVYKTIDKQVDNLQKNSCVSCIKGCGACCKRFEPYISVLEAIPVAHYLKNNPEKYEAYKKNNEKNRLEWNACPLYDEDNPNHCTIYTIRPLICRMFGFSANRNRRQEVSFSTCQKIEKEMPKRVESAKKLVKKGLDVPVYQDIAKTIQQIDFEMATDYHPFSKSVDIALNQYDKIMKDTFKSSANNSRSNFSHLLRKKIRNESP